jgi:hypothetical protein
MNDAYTSLDSEIRELENLLSTIPVENVIDRKSFEIRLENAKKILEKSSQQVKPSYARLTFRGKPVFGSRGILADFGARAAALFSELFTVVAGGLNENLRDFGPIPDRVTNRLLITGTAIGSFGFEFELPPKESDLFSEIGPAEEAMGKIENLFRTVAEGNDDEVAEIVTNMHQRSIKKTHEFLIFLVQQGAWCGLEFDDKFFRFLNYDQIKFAADRIGDDNIHESRESYCGEFQGVLPTGRTFEFKLLGQKEIIRGKVERTIDDPDILNREWLHKLAGAKFNLMQVGQGRPRYTLMSLDDISTYNG